MNHVSPRANRIIASFNSMRTQIFCGMLLISLVPLYILTENRQKSALLREISVVEQGHLIIARNLASTLERYVRDVKATFSHFVQSRNHGEEITEIGALLENYELNSVYQISDGGRDLITLLGSPLYAPSQQVISDIKKEMRGGEAQLTGVTQAGGRPMIYISQQDENGILFVGALNTNFVIEQQSSISFGERGHSMIVDQFGRVMAHPNLEWTQNSVDASKLDVVQQMIQQNTGVMKFFSPPLNADMIAGYTFVPNVGWGVMVPQPMAELEAAAKIASNHWFRIIISMMLIALVCAWVISGLIVGPINNISDVFRQIKKGKSSTRIKKFRRTVPSEFNEFGRIINTTLDELNKSKILMTRSLNVAREANLHKSQAISILSHEMRTPLNGLIGALNLLGRTSLDNEQSKYIDVAATSSTTLLRHVNSVLESAKLEKADHSLKISNFDLYSLVKDIISENSSIAEKKGVTISFDYSEELSELIQSDADRMRSILSNIVGNSVKFTDFGQISIELKPSDDHTLSICVSDTGLGIPSDELDNIFEPFVVVNERYNQSNVGTGLGLSIVKKSIEALEGTIVVKSEVNKGTSFELTLPTHGLIKKLSPSPAIAREQITGPTAIARAKSLTHSTESNPLQVLVVDDNEINLLVLSQQLLNLGCKVKTANDGVQALDMLDKVHFDAVFMDVRMPNMNGIEATKKLRASSGPNQSTLVVAQTAHAVEEDLEAFYACGMEKFLQKPILQQNLMEIVNEIKASLEGINSNIGRLGEEISIESVDLIRNALGENNAFVKYDEIFNRAQEILDFLQKSIPDSRDGVEHIENVHSISGECAAIGAFKLNSLFKKLESNLKLNSTNELPKLLKRLQKSIHAARREMQLIFNG